MEKKNLQYEDLTLLPRRWFPLPKLDGYILREFLIKYSVLLLVFVILFILSDVYRDISDFLEAKASYQSILQYLGYKLPGNVRFILPISMLLGCMWTMATIGKNMEITAMRACGVSILQIVSPILIITFFLMLFCLYLQVEVGPPLLGKSRTLMQTAAINQPLAIFEPGKQIEFENTIIYIDDKEGEDGIKGVQIYTLSDPQTVAQDISAERGKLLVDKEKQLLIVRLFDCLVVDKKGAAEQQQDGEAGMPTRFFTQQLEFSFNYGKQANERRISTKAKYMKLTDLMGKIRLTKQLERDTTELEVELNQRIAFALSPIAFLLLGLPLAIRTSRRETSVGLFLSVILAGVFFLSIILCESLSSFPHLYPQYLLWLPNIIFQILGAVMTYRISQR